MKRQPLAGSFSMLQSLWHHVFPGADHNAGVLYQTSVMSALVDGIYEGEMTYGELHRHGDFGLGTFNSLDGEMVGFDGNFYQLRSDGSAHLVTDEQKTPFAVVTFFKPDREEAVSGNLDKAALLKLIEGMTDANLFSAIRIDGVFDEVRTRTVERQERPYPSLTQATDHEAVNTSNDVRGTLAGFRSPSYVNGIGIAGFHLHFLHADKQSGGHALDFIVKEGTVRIAPLRDFHVELPKSSDFLKAKLDDPDISAKIKGSES